MVTRGVAWYGQVGCYHELVGDADATPAAVELWIAYLCHGRFQVKRSE